MAQARVRREKDPGYYWFPATWLGSEIRRCSFAAKGLWMDVLCNMWDREPRGVAPGDAIGLVRFLGMPEEVADACWVKIKPLLDELEGHNVFSRGEDFGEDLDRNAIVNRRMYRDWMRAVGRSYKARIAANIRHHGSPGGNGQDAEACSSDARGDARGDAREMLTGGGDPLDSSGLPMDGACSGDAQAMPGDLLGGCHSLPYPTLPNSKSDEIPRSRGGDIEGVGDLAMVLEVDMDPLAGGKLYSRVLAVSGDEAAWKAWWRSALRTFEAAGFLGAIVEKVAYVEQCADPVIRKQKGLGRLKSPGRFLTSAVLQKARDLKLELPPLPSRQTK